MGGSYAARIERPVAGRGRDRVSISGTSSRLRRSSKATASTNYISELVPATSSSSGSLPRSLAPSRLHRNVWAEIAREREEEGRKDRRYECRRIAEKKERRELADASSRYLDRLPSSGPFIAH